MFIVYFFSLSNSLSFQDLVNLFHLVGVICVDTGLPIGWSKFGPLGLTKFKSVLAMAGVFYEMDLKPCSSLDCLATGPNIEITGIGHSLKSGPAKPVLKITFTVLLCSSILGQSGPLFKPTS